MLYTYHLFYVYGGDTNMSTLWPSNFSKNQPPKLSIQINQPNFDGPTFCLVKNGSSNHFTPRKTNRSLENQWLEDVFPIEIYSPLLGDVLVFGRVRYSVSTCSQVFTFFH